MPLHSIKIKNNPVAILMLTPEFPPIITGGLGIACYELVKALLKYNIKIYLVLPKMSDRPRQKTGKDFTYYYFTLTKAKDANIISKTFSEKKIFSSSPYFYSSHQYLIDEANNYEKYTTRISKNLGFNIIHAHDWFTYPAGIRIKQETGKPLICHVHSTEYDRRKDNPNAEILCIEKKAFQAASKIITVSEYTAKKIKKYYDIDNKKIVIVHNATPLTKVVSMAQTKRSFRVAFIGRLTKQKSPMTFIKIAERVISKLKLYNEGNISKESGNLKERASIKDIEFVIAGEGELKKQIKNYIKNKNLGDYIKVKGFLQREEIEELLVNTDILLLTSSSEPFGLVILEAMSLGAIPVIPKEAGAGEVLQSPIKIDIKNEDKVANTLIQLLSNKKNLSRIKSKCIKEAKKHRWENAAKKIMKIYREYSKRYT